MKNIICENQLILSKIISNIITNQNASQAYILYGNDDLELKRCSKILSKALICNDKYTNKCSKCNICKRIDTGNFSDLLEINPENRIIKKEKIINIKEKFNTNSIEGKRQVYIIHDAELLNTSSSNSLLKFIEEPDSNVVAIFTTKNYDRIIKTISSRCQAIKINDKRNNRLINDVVDLSDEEISNIITMIKHLELDYTSSILNIKDDFILKYNTKDKLYNSIKLFSLFYNDILRDKNGLIPLYFEKNDINTISEKNDIIMLSKKITLVLENLSKLEYNVSTTLYILNLFVKIGEINNDRSSRN